MSRGGQISSVNGRRVGLTPLVAVAGPLNLGNKFTLSGQVLQYQADGVLVVSPGAGVTVEVSITTVDTDGVQKNYTVRTTTDAMGKWEVTFTTAAPWFQNQIVVSGRAVGVSNGGKGFPGAFDVQPALYGTARNVNEVVQSGGSDTMTNLTLREGFKK